MRKKLIIFILAVNSLTYGIAKDRYTVVKGDSLNRIAYEHKVSTKKLIELNNIKNPDLIYPGMELILHKERVVGTYSVKKNDTLRKIAEKYDMMLSELLSINKIENPDLIYPNMKIKVYSELEVLALKYEKIGDEIWNSQNKGLDFKINKSLNNYLVAKQMYRKSELNYSSSIDRKIAGLESLKKALKYENSARIYDIKNMKELALENYEKSLEEFRRYQKNSSLKIEELKIKIENIEKIVSGGKNVKENI